MQAFVLVSLTGCNEGKCIEEFKSLREVEEAYVLFGEWDLLLEIKTDSAEDLGTFVMEKIRSKPEVKLTSSLIVAGK